MQWKAFKQAGLLLFTMLLAALSPRMAAGSVSGSVEFDYNHADISSTDTSGNTTKIKTDSYLQRYQVNVDDVIYPYLTFKGGYIFQRQESETKINDKDTTSYFTTRIPSLELDWANPYFHTGVRYSETDQLTSSTGTPGTTLEQDTVSANFGLKRSPELPTLDIGYSRSHTFDQMHTSIDQVTQGASVTSRYLPTKNLQLRYTGAYNDTENNLVDTKVESYNNQGYASYTTGFFKNRVSVSAEYTVSDAQTKVTTGGAGSVSLPVLPVQGLAGIDTPPNVPSLDTLVSSPDLVDNNVSDNVPLNPNLFIGLPPLPDTNTRNFGLDLGSQQTVNTLYVWVDQNIRAIAMSYTWDVYISSDTGNTKNWTLWQSTALTSFGVFDNRFEITFPNVTTRFIKVVTRLLSVAPPPGVLPPGVNANSIYVTELQAFLTESAQQAKGTSTALSQVFDMYVSTLILDNPHLVYNLYYWYQQNQLGGVGGAGSRTLSGYIISNNLNLTQRITRILSGTAQVTREDSHQGGLESTSYNYSAALTATPLPTLTHSLVVSGSQTEIAGLTSDSKSAFLTNTAELYKGVNISLSGGEIWSTQPNGLDTTNSAVTFALALVPNRKLSINYTYGITSGRETGGGLPDRDTGDTINTVSLGYYPFTTLYLFAQYSTDYNRETEQNTSSQNYSLSWSPFPDGALQLTTQVTELKTSADQGDTTAYIMGASYKINPRLFLTSSYNISKTRNVTGNSRTESEDVDLRWLF